MVLGQVIAGSEFLKTLFATMEFRETLTVFSDTRVEQKIMAVNFRHFGVFSQLPVHAARVNCMGQLLNPPDQNVSWLSIMSYAREIVHVFFSTTYCKQIFFQEPHSYDLVLTNPVVYKPK